METEGQSPLVARVVGGRSALENEFLSAELMAPSPVNYTVSLICLNSEPHGDQHHVKCLAKLSVASFFFPKEFFEQGKASIFV